MATVRLTPGDSNPLRVTNAINKNADEYDANALTTADFATQTEAEDATAEDKVMSPARVMDLINANFAIPAVDLSDIYTRLSNLEAARINPFQKLGNGWVEIFDDAADIDAGSSSNYTIANGYARPTVSGGVDLAGTTILGTIGTSAALRNGVTSVAAASSVRKTSKLNIPLYAGYTLTTASALSAGVLYGSNDQGFFQSTNPTFDIFMYASTAAEGAPTSKNITTWGRQIGALTKQTDTSDESGGRTVPVDSAWAATVFKHVWFALVRRDGADQNACFAEVSALDPLVKPSMTLVGKTLAASGAITEMAATIFVKLREPITVNTDYVLELSTNGGSNWTTMTLVDQSSDPLPGEASGDWRQYTVDFSSVSNAGVTPKWRITTPTSKDVETHQFGTLWQ